MKGTSLARFALVLGVAALTIGIVGAAPVLTGAGGPAAEDREIRMLAVEYKGTAGAGEKIEEGSKVSAYSWTPSSISANKGDRVTLKIYGVNGGAHPSSIQGYPEAIFKVFDPNGTLIEEGTGTFGVYRGHTTEVKFTASKVGIFTIGCAAHQPTMDAYLTVFG
jgi:plastocyanin